MIIYRIGSYLLDSSVYDLRQENKQRLDLKVKLEPLHTRFMRVTKRGDIIFRTRSGTTPGKFWYQTIRFLDLEKYVDDDSLSDKEKLLAMYKGNIAVWCNDPSWQYYWQFRGTERGFSIKPERRPHRRNPELPGTTCKHIEQVLSVLGFHIPTIVKQYQQYKVFKKDEFHREQEEIGEKNILRKQ